MTPATWEHYQEAKARLTPEQIERIKAKCAWEHMTWFGVFQQWPSLFAAVPAVGSAEHNPAGRGHGDQEK